jgi:DNA-binding response OmpR family regulator
MAESRSILAGLTVLVLEDEPIIAMSIEDQLEQAGAMPMAIGSIEGAEALLLDHAFDAAILDINVHGQKSYSVARSVAERGIPFVFASGYGDTLHPEEFVSVPTVTKPYDLAAIERALDVPLQG